MYQTHKLLKQRKQKTQQTVIGTDTCTHTHTHTRTHTHKQAAQKVQFTALNGKYHYALNR